MCVHHTSLSSPHMHMRKSFTLFPLIFRSSVFGEILKNSNFNEFILKQAAAAAAVMADDVVAVSSGVQ
jgi:hypothetical protein